MTSFVRHMFRSKKSSSNKENDAGKRSTLNRTYQGDLERIGENSLLSEPQRRHLELLPSNPYSIVTEPKKNRGPRSCPGGVQRAEIDHRPLRHTQPRPDMNQSYRASSSMSNRRGEKFRYGVEELFEWDDPPRDARDEKIARLQEKLSRSKIRELRLQDEVTRLADELQDAKAEEMEARDDAEHYKHKFKKLQMQREVDRKMLHKISAELQRAQRRVLDLEADSGNDSALLSHQNNLGKTRIESGAGEALCRLNEPLYENEKRINNSQISRQPSGHTNTEDEDEVRIFRRDESSDETEKPREFRNSNDLKLSRQNTNVTLNELPIGCSSSETDLSSSDRLNGNDFEASFHQQLKMPTSSTPHRRRLTNEPFITPFEENMTASSDEERYAFLERQLRRKGEVVRYNPPRQQLSQRHFRRKFSQPEREALLEFKYLMDMSTDVSGLISSPEARS
ncbi:unnamed protein product, partial [Mesorhabditis belari]|uniref:Uncharacterized protein n=1 Tax=Mesorhabditis belari TaxID=2138241 RepID=A0AAF3ETX2_9BILA